MTHPHATQLDDLIAVLGEFRSSLSLVEEAGKMMAASLRSGGKLLTCGNGGSAADALHLSEELVGRFLVDRPSLASLCLCADPTLLTCIGNDYGFESLFSRQVEGIGCKGDVLVVFSSSGNSVNLVKALEAANRQGMHSVAALGKDGGKCRGLATCEIIVPTFVTARAQEVHGFMIHLWLTLIESSLGYS